MSISIKVWLIISVILIYFDVFIICRLLINRLKSKEHNEFLKNKENYSNNLRTAKHLRKKSKDGISSYLQIKQFIRLDTLSKENIEKNIDINWAEQKYLKGLKSISKTKRIEAVVYLGLIGTSKNRLALEKLIMKEKDYTIKLYIANALADIGNKESIPVLVASLINSHRFYRDKVNMLISDFGEDFNSYLPTIVNDDRIEINELIVDFSSIYFSECVKKYLVELIDSKDDKLKRLYALFESSKARSCRNCLYSMILSGKDKRFCKFKGEVNASYCCCRYKILPVSINCEINYRKLIYKACDVLATYYPKELDNEKYLNSEDNEIKNIAIRSLANFNDPKNIELLMTFLQNEDTSRSAVNAISSILEKNPAYINTIANAFAREKEIKIRKELAKILSIRIEYFIMKLLSKSGNDAAEIIKEVLLLGRNSEVIDFLNKNKDIDIENELIAIIKEVVSIFPTLKKEFSKYLSERIVKKCGFVLFKEIIIPKKEQKDMKLIVNLYILLGISILMFPIIYCFRHQDIIFKLSLIEQIKIFVIDFNYYIAFYSMTISVIYLGLLILSYMSAKKQVRLRRVKNKSLLFKNRMLPTISIIAPAYNEEKTIIESANSLLNLKYPEYELIIVNDGSKDRTLDVLIKYFDLTRVDYVFNYELNTKPVRGIYMNRSMPKLIVVDKENGGKADSLNAGINISHKEYFCGIDADSLLEDEALLKLAALTLDEGTETPALGGNIFPINGCTVEQGQIKNIKIPSSKLGRFQTIEYIRAFMSGRLGWASLNSLLIISGAFGLFRKERVISVGGYLTSSGKYEKDTVGEDMELVVRISRFMRELGHKYRICYAFNANCWTEVPEDFKTLKRQRYRWHRGLIDILIFHKKMIFNPRYGIIGTIAMPYFFIFEMVGPMVEIQGYFMFILALLLGLLNKEIALILFASTVLMGVLISVSSLMIAEKDFKDFKLKDIIILIFYSCLENFGPRQLFSLWRVGGYLNVLKKPSGWDKAERKGFSSLNIFTKGK